MAKYDKYEPKAGGFRAALADDLASTSATGNGNPIGVGLSSSGLVEAGASDSGIVGILCTTNNKKAGEIVDVMTDGEVTELAGLTAGTVLTANIATGVLSNGAPSATQVRVGHTVEASRLVVRVVPEVIA